MNVSSLQKNAHKTQAIRASRLLLLPLCKQSHVLCLLRNSWLYSQWNCSVQQQPAALSISICYYLSFCLISLLLPGQTSHGSQVFILMASFSPTSLILEHLLKLLALIILLFECKYFAWGHNKYIPDFGASERRLLCWSVPMRKGGKNYLHRSEVKSHQWALLGVGMEASCTF